MAKKPEKIFSKYQEHVQMELDEEEDEVDKEQQKQHEEEEVQELEEEVKEMAQKILDYRATLPAQLKSTFASVLSDQRPVIHTFFDSASESTSGSSSEPNAVRPSGSGNETLMEVDDEYTEKIKFLKEKISSNAKNIPVVIKRMKDCMARIDQLESQSGIIHPAFKRKKPS